MDIFQVLEQLNIIDLLNTVLPKGIGEFIVLVCWLGFFFQICVMVAAWALTREQIAVNARCRITMDEIGVVMYPGGSTREFRLPRNADVFSVKMGDETPKWTIEPDEWMTKSNGVRFTFFHPEIPHNVSINSLIHILNSKQTMMINDKNEVEFIPIENITYSAFDQDAKVNTLAAAYAQDIVDPHKKLYSAAIAVSLVLAVGFVIAIIFMWMPKPATQVVYEVTRNMTEAAKTVTTTIPRVSTIGK